MRKLPIEYESVLGLIKLENGHHLIEVVFQDEYGAWFLQWDAKEEVEVVKWGYLFNSLYKEAQKINGVK